MLQKPSPRFKMFVLLVQVQPDRLGVVLPTLVPATQHFALHLPALSPAPAVVPPGVWLRAYPGVVLPRRMYPAVLVLVLVGRMLLASLVWRHALILVLRQLRNPSALDRFQVHNLSAALPPLPGNVVIL